MGKLIKPEAWWKSSEQPPEPPDMDLTERVIKLESKLDAALPTLATKADLHSEFSAQTWKIVSFVMGFGTLLAAAVFFIAKNVH